MTVFNVPAVRGLQLDQCAACGGVWFDLREREYLKAVRNWQAQQETLSRETTWGEWWFQFLLQLPVEFNIRPRRFPIVTACIVAICVVLHLLGGPTHLPVFDPTKLVSGQGVAGLLMHQFLHASWIHLLGNMYLLYILGDNVEDVLSSGWFLLLYLGCGTVAGLGHALASDVPMVGASGAVAGIMAAYLVLFRRAQLTFMLVVFQFKVPAWAWLGLWFAVQILGIWADPTGEATRVAWMAHLTGFLAALLVIWPCQHVLVDRHPLLQLLRNDRLIEVAE